MALGCSISRKISDTTATTGGTTKHRTYKTNTTGGRVNVSCRGKAAVKPIKDRRKNNGPSPGASWGRVERRGGGNRRSVHR